jgi:hypothetical protein
VEMDPRLRRRIWMFNFAAIVNAIMGVFVLSSGASAGGTLTLVSLIFFAFAVGNYYMARLIRRQWDSWAEQQRRQRSGVAD